MSAFPKSLLAGHLLFRDGCDAGERARYAALAQRAAPETMVIGCCDARVSPEVVFGAAPGELFVLRVIAGLVAPRGADADDGAVAAALEYAVLQLSVRHIVVLGHSFCAGVGVALEADPAATAAAPHLARWVEMLRPVVQATAASETPSLEERRQRAEQRAVEYSLENLQSFPFIDDARKRGDLSLHGAWFDIGGRALQIRNPQTGAFSNPPPQHPAPPR